MTNKYLLPIVVVLLLLLATSCITVVNPPTTTNDGTTGGGTTPPQQPTALQLDIRVQEGNAIALGRPVTYVFSVNQPAQLTLGVLLPNGTTVILFQNVLYNAGEHQLAITAGLPIGQRLATLAAVNTAGQVTSASVVFTVTPSTTYHPE